MLLAGDVKTHVMSNLGYGICMSYGSVGTGPPNPPLSHLDVVACSRKVF